MPSIHFRVAAPIAALLTVFGMPTAIAGAVSAAASVKTVNCNNAGNLQSALNAVSSGGTVKVSGVCTGNFSIGKNMTVEGSPSATLDGGGTGTVLDIAPSLTVRVSHLAIEDGFGGGGAGVFVGDSDHLRLTAVTVSHNQSYGGGAGLLTDDNAVVTVVHSHFSFNNSALTNNTPVALRGAAIAAGGNLTLDHSTFTDNTVTATSSNSTAYGGAVFAAANLDVTDSTFARNVVQGTTAEGGSIWASGSSLKIVNSTFADDRAVAVDPDDAQTATGGSIYSMAAAATMQGVRITGSRALINGPAGGQVLGGAALFAYPVHIVGSVFKGNVVKGVTTGDNSEILAQGGGLLLEPSASTTIRRTTIEGNSVAASSTQGSAYAEGGGIFGFGVLSASESTVSRNMVAASSGMMALGSGGGIMVSSQVNGTTVTNSTIADNSSAATLGKGAAPTATATGSGGGVQDESQNLSFRYSTVAGNSTRAAGGGQGGGLDLTPGLGLPKPRTLATIWSGNKAKLGPQCAGGFTSSGWNLFAGLTGCATTAKNSDHTHGGAHLAALESNGGPTKTIALKAGSDALDQIPRATCRAVVTTDQRGVSRPQGAAKKASRRRCDIGAYERTVTH